MGRIGVLGQRGEPNLLPSVGQGLTLDHFFVANAELLLLLSTSLNQDAKEGKDHGGVTHFSLSLALTPLIRTLLFKALCR